MAYNKTKHLDAAQKYLHQGKIAQAISEYQTILKHESKDQVTLMTIGDLYVRQGETFQALEYFERLAQIFLSDGFVTKAIAIYKKIAKLAPEEPRPVERLAELYVQQGVLSEARPIYLQLAELHQRAGRQPQAAAMLRKLLEAEPDNLRVQTRLAELSLAMRKPDEAAESFRAAAQLLQNRGDHAEAIEYADKALKIDARDAAAQTIKARSLAAAGEAGQAATLLESMPNLDAEGQSSELLLDLCIERGDMERASTLASKLFARNTKQFAAAHRVAETLLESSAPDQAFPMLDLVRQAMADAGEQERLARTLVRATERLPERSEPREWLVELYRGTSDSFRLPAALSELAETYQKADRNADAKRVLEELVGRDPENDQASRAYERVLAKMGLEKTSANRGSEEPPLVEASAKEQNFPEPPLDEETQRFVSQALTDVDLFSTYGLRQKAAELLEMARQRAPEHAPILERMLDLHVGAGDERRTAELAAQLEELHASRGNTAAAERFAELRRRFERAAGAAPAAAQTAEFSIAPREPEADDPAAVEPDPVGAMPSAEPEPAVHEVDLSEEWAALSAELAAAEPEPQQSPAGPEEMAATEKQGRAEIDSADVAETVPEYALELEPALSGVTGDDLLGELSSELDGILPSTLPAQRQAPAEKASEPAEMSAAEIAEPAADPAEIPADTKANGHTTEMVAEAALHATETADPLGDVFNEFRADLDEHTGEKEDPETHYNLGIAYREMGLLDEAISEFQRVAKVKKNGKPFRYAMQCCTLLGLAFIEKGQPAIAAMWYERALESPGLEQESIIALRYDLGVAQELAGDTNAARKSFSQVYGMNIDYRDVAERLAALGKG